MKAKNQLQKKNAGVSLIAGIEKYLADATFLIAGKQSPAAEVIAVIQGRVDAANALSAAAAAYHGAVQANAAKEASTDAFVAAVQQIVLAMYSNSPEILAAFAVSPKRVPAPQTAGAKLIAAKKREATRKARHTLGARQKAAIVGSLTGPVVVSPDGSTRTDDTSSTSG
jgi:hypothetical protein